MSSRARAALLGLTLLLCLTAGPAGTAAAQTAQVDSPAATTFVITLQPDGDARWTVRLNVSLDSTADREAFQSLASDFESGGDLRTLTAFRAAVEEASTATGREMTLASVERSSETYNDTGQLVIRFTWTNFARTTGQRLTVDDAFNSTGGTWLQSLGQDQALVVSPPDGYTLVDATPSVDEVSSGSLRWEGPRTFGPGDLSVTYRSVDRQVTFPVDVELVVGTLLLGGLLLVGLVLYRRGSLRLPSPAADPGDGSGDEGASAAATAESSTDDEVDEELLSDEERIERLLERNGGRMKQADIVKETDWSNAKVSQLLSSMDEAGRIDKLRIGRENLISFPDEDAAGGEDASH
ncbi:MAG: helix-turn-helix transcriptional regulator [Halorientalis sp.]